MELAMWSPGHLFIQYSLYHLCGGEGEGWGLLPKACPWGLNVSQTEQVYISEITVCWLIILVCILVPLKSHEKISEAKFSHFTPTKEFHWSTTFCFQE